MLDKMAGWLHLAITLCVLTAFTCFTWALRQSYALVPGPISYLLDCVWLRSKVLRKYFAFRLGADDDQTDHGDRPRRTQTAGEMIREAGFSCQEHMVETSDGYILGLQRIIMLPGIPGLAGFTGMSSRAHTYRHAAGLGKSCSTANFSEKELQVLAARLGLETRPEAVRTDSRRRVQSVDWGQSSVGSSDDLPRDRSYATSHVSLNDGSRVLPAAPQSVRDPYLAVPNASRPPVLMMHGLMQSSEAWLACGLTATVLSTPRFGGRRGLSDESGDVAGARLALPYLLAEAGYDVWLGNARGNRYSCSHIRLSPDSSAFWDFSIDHMARYDLPSMIDYIISYTGYSRVAYVAFSQGTATMFAALSSQPSLSSRISVFAALSPAMALKGLARSPVTTLLAHDVEFLYTLFGYNRMLSLALDLQRVLSPSSWAIIIDASLAYLFGWRMHNVDPLAKPRLYAHLYSFTSVQTVVHWFNIIANRRFAVHSGSPLTRPTGIMDRIARIGATFLPVPFLSSHERNAHRVLARYDTSHITVPLGLWVGGKDTLIDPLRLLAMLPSLSAAVPMPPHLAGTVLHQPGPGMPAVTLPTRYRDARLFGSAAAAVYAISSMSRPGKRTGRHARMQSVAVPSVHFGGEGGEGEQEKEAFIETGKPAVHPSHTGAIRSRSSMHPPSSPTLHDRALDAIASWVRGEEGEGKGQEEAQEHEQGLHSVAQVGSPSPSSLSRPLLDTGLSCGPSLGRMGWEEDVNIASVSPARVPSSGAGPDLRYERHPPFLFVQPEFEHLDFQWALPTVATGAWQAVISLLDRYKHIQVRTQAPLPVRVVSAYGTQRGGETGPLGRSTTDAGMTSGSASAQQLAEGLTEGTGSVGIWTPTDHGLPQSTTGVPSCLHSSPSVPDLPKIRHAVMAEVEATQGCAGPVIHRLRPGQDAHKVPQVGMAIVSAEQALTPCGESCSSGGSGSGLGSSVLLHSTNTRTTTGRRPRVGSGRSYRDALVDATAQRMPSCSEASADGSGTDVSEWRGASGEGGGHGGLRRRAGRGSSSDKRGRPRSHSVPTSPPHQHHSPHIGLNLSRLPDHTESPSLLVPRPLLRVEHTACVPEEAARAMHEPPALVIDGSALGTRLSPIVETPHAGSGAQEGVGVGGTPKVHVLVPASSWRREGDPHHEPEVQGEGEEDGGCVNGGLHVGVQVHVDPLDSTGASSSSSMSDPMWATLAGYS